MYFNGQSQGVMASELPEDLYFTVDLTDEGQVVRIVTKSLPKDIADTMEG